MTPKTSGVIGIIIGIVCIGIAWHVAQDEGRIMLFPCLLGPAVLPISVAFVVLPVRRLLIPEETEGGLVYDLRNSAYTPLGKGLMALGFVASGLFFLCLKYAI